MTPRPLLLIRADATPVMGTGHVMRCLALAAAAQRAGLECLLLTRAKVPWLSQRIAQTGIGHVPLLGDVPAKEPADQLLRDIAAALPAGFAPDAVPPWVVLDGYHFGPDCMRAVRAAGYRLLVVDDHAHHPEYTCDILLNQNIGADGLHYTGDISLSLFGPAHALLRDEFIAARARATPRAFPPVARNLLLSLGGGDQSAPLEQLRPMLEQPSLAGRAVRVIAGSTPEPALAALQRRIPATVELLPSVDDMPSLMHWADLCISAGGSTCWELCCLGVPFLTVAVAQNQQGIVRGLDAAGIAPHASASALNDLLDNPDARRAASNAGRQLVDGLGADRVVAHVTETPCLLRPVSPDDREIIWRIANSPDVRAVSCTTADIPWEEHCRWFERQLASTAPLFYTVCDMDGSPAGYVRFAVEKDAAVISTALAAHMRGRGLGTAAIVLGCQRCRREHPTLPIVAMVHPGNAASCRAFLKAGFILGDATSGDGATMHRLVLPPPSGPAGQDSKART
ncbi:acetyltransferase family protein [Desulfovibrio sp. A2]|nr:acetyltransferase family protein [Desulfovibrio sp. A2]